MLVAKNVVRQCTEALGAPGSDVTYQPRLYARWEITSPRCQPTEIAYRRGTGVIGLARRDGEAGTHVGKRHGGGGPRGSAGLGLRPLTVRNSGGTIDNVHHGSVSRPPAHPAPSTPCSLSLKGVPRLPVVSFVLCRLILRAPPFQPFTLLCSSALPALYRP